MKQRAAWGLLETPASSRLIGDCYLKKFNLINEKVFHIHLIVSNKFEPLLVFQLDTHCVG